jgi:hypothetical protein
MRVDGLLERVPQGPRYGPRLLVSARGGEFEERFQRTMERYSQALDWIAEKVRDRGVLELERLATALWVTRQLDRPASVDERARELVALSGMPRSRQRSATSKRSTSCSSMHPWVERGRPACVP